MKGDVTSIPRVVHIVHSLRVGGLENGLVNLINRMPVERYRHAVICLKDYDHFAERIERDDVPLVALDKREGKDPALYVRLWRALRQLRPEIVHTRNLAALEAQIPAWLSGVPARIHGEHGRDMGDLTGANRRYRRMRRIVRPLVHHYIPLSRDLEGYLRDAVGVSPERMTRITNGVDIERFQPRPQARGALLDETGWQAGDVIAGWVGRMEAVKNPLALVEAFAKLAAGNPAGKRRLRLALVGDGAQYEAVARAVRDAELDRDVWMPGARNDVSHLLAAMDLFALPSLAEGISNTVLEAMAAGVPVVATNVGGNAELIAPEESGVLIPPGDPDALAAALVRYRDDPALVADHGAAARRRAVEHFSIDGMVSAYAATYDHVLERVGRAGNRGRRLPSETA
ncbi:MAG: TIGR03088 family PEP-CTERM/XrtA system glycosyltransferase [Halofilum sp. (in: g-proteobacteria)]